MAPKFLATFSSLGTDMFTHSVTITGLMTAKGRPHQHS
jgi:hypothetical protein